MGTVIIRNTACKPSPAQCICCLQWALAQKAQALPPWAEPSPPHTFDPAGHARVYVAFDILYRLLSLALK